MSDRAQAAAAAIVSAVRDANDDGAPYLAGVSEVVDSTTVKIRPFSAVTGTQQNYAVMRGATVKVGDVVVVLPLLGGKMSVVLGQFSAGTLVANDFHIQEYQSTSSATNTSTTNYVNLASGTITLPEGTWYAVAHFHFISWHSALAHIDGYLDVGGVASWTISVKGDAGEGNERAIIGAAGYSGLTGSPTWAIKFKGDAAGTANANLPGVIFICRRTA